MFPDWVIEPTAAMGEMIRVRQEHGGSALLAVEVESSQVSNYSVFDVETTDDDRVKRVVGMVKKPTAEDAPLNLAATGRYLLDRAIFGALRCITPGKGGALQLTDTIALLISEGHPGHVVVHEGIRHDLGNPAGFIPASVEFGLRHPKYGPALLADLEVLLEKYRGDLG
ncbi:sugar phosphate nucleotidyltransferase [Corynebacterium marquesiae]|uniref:sugar phosphate nucleotidyltransferase n=1 Tax=Corynebacterium marquesiae TaxID=2913503 RepID=UPI0038D23FCE